MTFICSHSTFLVTNGYNDKNIFVYLLKFSIRNLWEKNYIIFSNYIQIICFSKRKRFTCLNFGLYTVKPPTVGTQIF